MKPIKGPFEAEYESDRRALHAALGERINRPVGERECDADQIAADSELMRQFYVKHRARLEAAGRDVTALLANLAASEKVVTDALAREEEAIEVELQATADVADARAHAAEAQVAVLRFYESMTEADWATLTFQQQEEMRLFIAELHADLPELMDALPIEKRRELEGPE